MRRPRSGRQNSKPKEMISLPLAVEDEWQKIQRRARRANKLLLVVLEGEVEEATSEESFFANELWTSPRTRHLLHRRFTTWHKSALEYSGSVYKQLQQVTVFPHAAILEPLTGRILWRVEGTRLTNNLLSDWALEFASSNIGSLATRYPYQLQWPGASAEAACLECALEMARATERLLIVYIQREHDQACVDLNKEVWQNDHVKRRIRSKFTLWYKTEHRHRLEDLPHLAIVDPVTESILWKREGSAENCSLTGENFLQVIETLPDLSARQQPPRPETCCRHWYWGHRGLLEQTPSADVRVGVAGWIVAAAQQFSMMSEEIILSGDKKTEAGNNDCRFAVEEFVSDGFQKKDNVVMQKGSRVQSTGMVPARVPDSSWSPCEVFERHLLEDVVTGAVFEDWMTLCGLGPEQLVGEADKELSFQRPDKDNNEGSLEDDIKRLGGDVEGIKNYMLDDVATGAVFEDCTFRALTCGHGANEKVSMNGDTEEEYKVDCDDIERFFLDEIIEGGISGGNCAVDDKQALGGDDDAPSFATTADSSASVSFFWIKKKHEKSNDEPRKLLPIGGVRQQTSSISHFVTLGRIPAEASINSVPSCDPSNENSDTTSRESRPQEYLPATAQGSADVSWHLRKSLNPFQDYTCLAVEQETFKSESGSEFETAEDVVGRLFWGHTKEKRRFEQEVTPLITSTEAPLHALKRIELLAHEHRSAITALSSAQYRMASLESHIEIVTSELEVLSRTGTLSPTSAAPGLTWSPRQNESMQRVFSDPFAAEQEIEYYESPRAHGTNTNDNFHFAHGREMHPRDRSSNLSGIRQRAKSPLASRMSPKPEYSEPVSSHGANYAERRETANSDKTDSDAVHRSHPERRSIPQHMQRSLLSSGSESDPERAKEPLHRSKTSTGVGYAAMRSSRNGSQILGVLSEPSTIGQEVELFEATPHQKPPRSDKKKRLQDRARVHSGSRQTASSPVVVTTGKPEYREPLGGRRSIAAPERRQEAESNNHVSIAQLRGKNISLLSLESGSEMEERTRPNCPRANSASTRPFEEDRSEDIQHSDCEKTDIGWMAKSFSSLGLRSAGVASRGDSTTNPPAPVIEVSGVK